MTDIFTVRVYADRLNLVLAYNSEEKAKAAYDKLSAARKGWRERSDEEPVVIPDTLVAVADDFGNALEIDAVRLTAVLLSSTAKANEMNGEFQYLTALANMHLTKKVDQNPQLKAFLGRSQIAVGPGRVQ